MPKLASPLPQQGFPPLYAGDGDAIFWKPSRASRASLHLSSSQGRSRALHAPVREPLQDPQSARWEVSQRPPQHVEESSRLSGRHVPFGRPASCETHNPSPSCAASCHALCAAPLCADRAPHRILRNRIGVCGLCRSSSGMIESPILAFRSNDLHTNFINRLAASRLCTRPPGWNQFSTKHTTQIRHSFCV